MNEPIFELVTFVPWMENGFEDHVVYTSVMVGPDEAAMGGRSSPELFSGPDGSVWLASRGSIMRAARIRGLEQVFFMLNTAEVTGVMALAPTLDGGLVLFGQDDSEKSVLARLSDKGELVWRREDMPPAQKNSKRAELRADLDGSIYLYTADRKAGYGGAGQVVQVRLDDGTITTIADFVENPPEHVWVQQAKLFWVAYSKGVRSWVSQDIQTGQQSAVEAEAALQSFLDLANGPILGGGALLTSWDDELVWMGPEGKEFGRLATAGIVRAGAGLAVALKEKNALTITQWQDAQRVRVVQVDSLGQPARLIYVDEEKYYLLVWNVGIAEVDLSGKVTTTFTTNANKLRLQREGGAPVIKAVAGRDGSILLVGVDPEGVYVVRMTGEFAGN